MKKELFGTTKDGKDIYLYTLENEYGMKAQVMNYGAILVNLLVPDKDGKVEDVCLGYDSLEEYYVNGCFFGSTIGPNGNRIADAQFMIDGRIYELAANDGVNNLHSDAQLGFHKKVWEAKEDGDNRVVFYLSSPDGEMGFPGNKKITVTYSVTEFNELIISYYAASDKKTVLNLTNHTYFNLAGHQSGSIENHLLTLHAASYTPVRGGLIPTGEIAPVAGTVMDFTKAKAIGKEIDAADEQLLIGGGYDHNWVLDQYNGRLREAAVVEEPVSGRVMKVFTDLPGVQFYAGNGIEKHQGKKGAVYEKRGGLCLETQDYPNAVNEPGFPSPVYGEGKDFVSTTIYQFVI